MQKFITLLLLLLFAPICSIARAQGDTVALPTFDDAYSKYVKQLESGDLEIDYAGFRDSFLESAQYSKKGMGYDSLKRLVIQEINNKNYQDVVRLTKEMLSIDYTSMFAHMYLQKTYTILGDTINRNKYHDIEFGLIYSIVNSGDGQTCETGWHVTQIEEEYFIINTVLGGRLNEQAITSSKHNMCDRMDIKTEKKKSETYYFEANKVFEMERKMFEK